MYIIDLLTPERTLYASLITSKKRALEVLSQLFAQPSGIDSHELFEAFIERERLGTTAIGHGIAIPHVRCKMVKQPQAALMVLPQALDFNALDQQQVDILVGLIVPAEATTEHLQILATLAESFSDESFCNQLRQATDSQSLYQIVVNSNPKFYHKAFNE